MSIAVNAGAGWPTDAAARAAPDSVKAIEEGLGRLLTDVALRRRLADGALCTARERDWNQVYERLLADYAEAVEGKRLTRAA